MPSEFKITRESIREFDATFKKFYRMQSRSLPDFTNKKAYMVARGAYRHTPKADKAKIKSGLREVITAKRHTGGGGSSEVERAVAIIQRRGPSPFLGVSRKEGAKAMREAVKKLAGARARAAGFFRAGWLYSIKKARMIYKGTDGPLPGTKEEKAMKNLSRLGEFRAAKEGLGLGKCVAEIVNKTLSKYDKSKRGVVKVGESALRLAMDEERASMIRELERRMKKDAQESGIKAH